MTPIRYKVLLYGLLITQHAAFGQQNNDPQTQVVAEDGDQQTILLESLPEPPTEIKKLIELGEVKLITAGSTPAPRDALPIGMRLAGQTRFDFRYRYDSHASWQIISDRSTSSITMVQVRVRFRALHLDLSHLVWLRNPPPSQSFWQNSIVTHEFDHVRISADPLIEARFRAEVKKLERMQVPLTEISGNDGRVDPAKVQSMIESRVQQIMADTTDLVRVRYQELDRLTRHGTLPLPKGTTLIPNP